MLVLAVIRTLNSIEIPFPAQFLERRHRMPRGLIVPLLCLHHEPFQLRIKVRFSRIGEEYVDFWRQCLNAIQGSGSDDCNDTLCLESIMRGR